MFVKAFIVAYGAPPFELVQHLWEGIGRVTRSLEDGDVPLAMMKATFLKFPEIEADYMAKLEAGEVEKVNPFHDAFAGGFVGVSGVEKSTYQTSAGELENARALEIALHGAEEVAKFNHFHDPKNGQFTFAPCGDESNPEAQEKALTDVRNRNSKQLSNYGVDQYVGTTIQDSKGIDLTITSDGLAAAAHREGANNVKNYLTPGNRNKLQTKVINAIETRLRWKRH